MTKEQLEHLTPAERDLHAIKVAPFHLQRYVDEQVRRFNSRKADDGERFAALMRTVPGRRLTYRQLTQQDGCGFMGLE